MNVDSSLTVSNVFLFINKTLRLNNLKTKTAMNAKISVFVISVVVIMPVITWMTVPLIKIWYLWKAAAGQNIANVWKKELKLKK